MSSIAGIDTWYRYRYRYLGIERGIDTLNRYRDEVLIPKVGIEINIENYRYLEEVSKKVMEMY